MAAGPPKKRSARRSGFDKTSLYQATVAIPLLRQIAEAEGDEEPIEVVIDLNLDFHNGLTAAGQHVDQMLKALGGEARTPSDADGSVSSQYRFTSLRPAQVQELARRDRSEKGREFQAIYRIWPDFKVRPLINRSVATIKADAAQKSFSALGRNIVWAVVDSGIDETHPHFVEHGNLDLDKPLAHRDFTTFHGRPEPLVDAYDHGTHVAGIIAGEVPKEKPKAKAKIVAATQRLDEKGGSQKVTTELDAISGVAPQTKLLSLKVLVADGNGDGTGRTSAIIRALTYVQELNGWGRRILVHGVNLSLGYPFEPEWFACGQSPLCVEIERLVRSGVVVVVAAGNSGYGIQQSDEGPVAAGLDLTIDDPGNAERAITVGSTHRDMPHTYGVSYFSSKGPTGDGRCKPDLIAPGEKIVSCTASDPPKKGAKRSRRKRVAHYHEDSGTSMAAPHVSGVIAAFLSIRREFIGRPEDVKRILMSTATDLGRSRDFQGAGLVDAMRAIQSV